MNRLGLAASGLLSLACAGHAPPERRPGPELEVSREVVGTSRPPVARNPESAASLRDGGTPRTASPEPTRVPPVHPEGESTLDVPGFDPAVVSFPPAGVDPSPLVFVAHGARDLPAAECALFRAVLGPRGTLVCLRGPRADFREEARYFPDHSTLEKILVTTSRAFHDAWDAPGAAPEPAVYAGYSQGATMGALILPSHAREYSRLLLVEGGFGDWTAARAAEFVQGGGRRVAFVCGTKRCAEQAPVSAHLLRKAGAESRVDTNWRAGHDHGTELMVPIRKALTWLLTDASPEPGAKPPGDPSPR